MIKSKILEYIQGQLLHYGILKNSDKFIYVDVDNEYIHKLISFIQDDGFIEPPYFGTSDLVGAHISVIYQEEMGKYNLDEIKECGNTISFIPKGCQIIRPVSWPEMEQVCFIVVESPELDRIRKKYGLPKGEHEFHITIGVKPLPESDFEFI